MSERGVFAVDRGIFDHYLFKSKEPFSRREAWLWLLSEAEWRPQRRMVSGQIVELSRGQLSHSVRFMAEAWGWSKSAVDRFLGRLKTETMIGTESGTGVLVITICKYNDYQKVSLPSRDNDGTKAGTAAGQQRDRLENNENIEGISSLRSDITPAAKPSPAKNDLSDFMSVLAELGPDRLDALIKVRRAKRAPINAYSATLFLKAAEKCRITIIEAADMCIERNWLTVKPEWIAPPMARGAAPPQKPRNIAEASTQLLERMRNANTESRTSDSLPEQNVPRLAPPVRQFGPRGGFEDVS